MSNVRTSGRRIRIGTRGSALARWQAEHVASAIRGIPGAGEPELVLIKTEGDQIQDVPLSTVQGKAFFTKEIEEALLSNRVDLAVHSLKDLATEMPSGLFLGAVMKREDPRDVLLVSPALSPQAGPSHSEKTHFSLEDLPRGARVGTSSLRRRALLAKWRPDLELLELRGNVPTRLRKLDAGDYDAIVLAAAGVKRLGLENRITAFLPTHSFLPAVSQGAIGIQTREEDEETLRWLPALEDAETRWATTAERAFLRTLEGGCQVPVGALGEFQGEVLQLRGVICSVDGSRSVDGEVTGPAEQGEDLGRTLAGDLLQKGGRMILEGIRGYQPGKDDR